MAEDENVTHVIDDDGDADDEEVVLNDEIKKPPKKEKLKRIPTFVPSAKKKAKVAMEKDKEEDKVVRAKMAEAHAQRARNSAPVESELSKALKKFGTLPVDSFDAAGRLRCRRCLAAESNATLFLSCESDEEAILFLSDE